MYAFERLAKSIALRHYKDRVHAVIAAYLDESFDMGPKGIFAVGGIIGRGIPLFELDRKWEALLHRPDINIEYYKASECWLGTGQFAKFVKEKRSPTPQERLRLDAISNEFVSLIAGEMLVGHGIGVIQSDFYDVIKDDYARSILGDDPFQLAYDLTMIQCAWIMKHTEESKRAEAQPWQKVERDYVSFVRDEHPKYAPLANTRYMNLKNSNPEAALYMATHSIADDKKVFVLQAADAVAYEIRRVLHLAHQMKPDRMREQFKVFRKFSRMGIIQTVKKENLLNTVSLHKPGEPFKLNDIMEQVFHENISIEEI